LRGSGSVRLDPRQIRRESATMSEAELLLAKKGQIPRSGRNLLIAQFLGSIFDSQMNRFSLQLV
jgi:hypothetical protein